MTDDNNDVSRAGELFSAWLVAPPHDKADAWNAYLVAARRCEGSVVETTGSLVYHHAPIATAIEAAVKADLERARRRAIAAGATPDSLGMGMFRASGPATEGPWETIRMDESPLADARLVTGWATKFTAPSLDRLRAEVDGGRVTVPTPGVLSAINFAMPAQGQTGVEITGTLTSNGAPIGGLGADPTRTLFAAPDGISALRHQLELSRLNEDRARSDERDWHRHALSMRSERNAARADSDYWRERSDRLTAALATARELRDRAQLQWGDAITSLGASQDEARISRELASTEHHRRRVAEAALARAEAEVPALLRALRHRRQVLLAATLLLGVIGAGLCAAMLAIYAAAGETAAQGAAAGATIPLAAANVCAILLWLTRPPTPRRPGGPA